MELELLEQIADERRDFAFALMIYKGDITHLKATLLGQASDGLIEVWNGGAHPVSVSQLKAAFADATLFVSTEGMKQWTITLTEHGGRAAFG